MNNKIVIISSHSDSLVRFRKEFIVSLLKKGFDVFVVAPDLNDKNAATHFLRDLGAHPIDLYVDRTGFNVFKDLKFLFSLFLFLRSIRPNYLFTYTVKPVIYGSLAGFFSGVPRRFALITGLGSAFIKSQGFKNFLLRNLIKLLYKISIFHYELVFFQNPDDRLLFEDLFLVSRDLKTTIVSGSGVDTKYYFPTPLPKNVSFLLFARLVVDKGINEYVAAARIVRNKYPGVRFGLVGWFDSKYNSIAKSDLNNWVAEGVIDFYGQLDDVRPAITNSSIFVLPSYREGTPRSVLEAMSMGRPVITTDSPGCRETVVDGDNGFLVPVKSVDELVVVMLKLVEQPKLIGLMGQRSRQIAEEKYDVNIVNEHMLKDMGIK